MLAQLTYLGDAMRFAIGIGVGLFFVFCFDAARADCWINPMGGVTGGNINIVDARRQGSKDWVITVNGAAIKPVSIGVDPRYPSSWQVIETGEKLVTYSNRYTESEVARLRAAAKFKPKNTNGAATASPNAACSDGSTAIVDLGEWGAWEVGQYMENSYFWEQVVFGDAFKKNEERWRRIQECRAKFDSCLSTTRILKDSATAACGGVANVSVAIAVACGAAVSYLSGKAEDQCWIDYAGCASGMASPLPKRQFAVSIDKFQELTVGGSRHAKDALITV